MPIENSGAEKSRPPWLVPVLVAATILIVMALGAYFLYGRELFQRPFLVVAVVIAWLGALIGINIGSDPG
jgi:hypothetical protein